MSALTLREIIEKLISLCPIKIVINSQSIYNDYDGGEFTDVTDIYNRFDCDNFIVSSVDIEVVYGHHSILYIVGYEKQTEVTTNEK